MLLLGLTLLWLVIVQFLCAKVIAFVNTWPCYSHGLVYSHLTTPPRPSAFAHCTQDSSHVHPHPHPQPHPPGGRRHRDRVAMAHLVDRC